MARGNFTTTCDVYTGPGTAFPGLFVGTFPCRLVIEDAIRTVGPGAPEIDAYLTIDDYTPRGSWETPFLGIDPALGDQIGVPSGSPVRFVVLYTDSIDWHGQDTYYRCYLIALPYPPIEAQGGVVADGSAIIESHQVVTGVGGVLADSIAQYAFLRRIVPTGGVKADSAAVESFTRFIVPTGGVKADSAATVVITPASTSYVVDYFTDTNGTNITAHRPDIWQGTGWTAAIGSGTIQSNQFAPSATLPTEIVIETNHANCTIDLSVVVPAGLSAVNILFRYADTNNHWRFQWEGSGKYFYLYSIVSGATAFIISSAPTTYNLASTTAALQVVLSGASITCKYNGTTVLSASGQTFNQTVTKHGIRSFTDATTYTAVARYDDFVARP